MYVRDLMTERVIAVPPTATLGAARKELHDHRIHHLVVMKDERVVGLLSFRDLIGRTEGELVGQVMSRDVLTIQPWDTVRSAAAMMLGRTNGCLPVVEGGKVTGIITTTDLLRAVTKEKSADVGR